VLLPREHHDVLALGDHGVALLVRFDTRRDAARADQRRGDGDCE
jgi:hypothetical protein